MTKPNGRRFRTMGWQSPFLFLACAAGLLAQAPPETILLIETRNVVFYREDIGDPLRWATSADPVSSPATIGNFAKGVWIADIVAVNGQPAKGVMVTQHQNVTLRPQPTGMNAIADVSRNNILTMHLEILSDGGAHVGSLVLSILGGISPALGVPASGNAGLYVVLGGTGAFFGVRGQGSNVSQTMRIASITENPINRRIHPGAGAWSFVLHLIPMTRPEVLTLPTGPAMFHGADFSPVTAEKPARAGELLAMSVSGLGPVRPNLEPGRPFPAWEAGKEHEVNSPVEVTVNGREARVLNKIGWPGMTNVYRVDIEVPAGTTPGLATLGMSAAWIRGPEVKFPVR